MENKSDFANLNFEYETLHSFSKQGLNSVQYSLPKLNNLNSFFKTFVKYGDSLYNNTRKSVETLINESSRDKSSLNTTINSFGKSYDSFMIRFKNTLNKVDKDIIDPITLFQQHLNTINQESFADFKSIISSTNDTKKNLEKIKQKYFENSKQAQEQEKSVLKSFTDKDKKRITTDEEVCNAHDILLKYRSQAENHAQLYKYELSKTNKTYEDNEKKYFPLIEKLKNTEESRIYFAKCHLEKFSKIFEEFAISTCDFLNKINSSIVEITVEIDIKSFSEKFRNNIINNLRIPKEEFLNYDIYRRNLESSPSKTNQYSSPASYFSNQIQSTNIIDLSQSYQSENNNDDFEMISNDQNHETNNQDRLIDEFITNMFKEYELNIEDIGKIMEILYGNIQSSQIFIDKIIFREKKNLSIKFNNYNNMAHFTNILITISLNVDTIENENYDINFAIIFIAERTYYNIDENNKIYQCAILARNKLYSSRKYWMDLMELKINRKVDNQVKKYNQEKQQNDMLVQQSPRANKSILGNLKNKFKTMFNNKEKSNIIQNSLPPGLFDKIYSHETLSVINEFIPHFANFNFDVSEAIDIIVELSSKYNLPKEKISYFVTKLNSNIFTIKNKLKPYQNKGYAGTKSNKFYDSKFLSLTHSLKFFRTNDYLSLMLMNKNYYEKLSSIFFKNILLKKKDLPLDIRLNIWKNILKINYFKSVNNYSEILKQVNISSQQLINEIITLDVHRTFFEHDTENKRTAISNILKAVAFQKPQINYCQGMNYIASFIFQIFNNEEESFYFMLSLFENTDFCNIFLDDLNKLKQYFYVFDRLLSLYLPELHSYFKLNQIIVSYFCSPWFITLFTNTYQYIGDNSHPKLILRIWDEFFLTGWKSVMKTGIILLKYYEKTLIQLKYEDLLHFLINDIIKSGFFQNSNLDTYISYSENIKIKSGLINNLENENLQESKYREIEERKK